MDANMSLTQPTFLFDDRKRFEAKREYERLRNSLPLSIDAQPALDLWNQRPIDFTMVNFHPNRKKNSHLSPVRDTSPTEKRSRHARVYNPAVMKPFEVSQSNSAENTHSDNDDHGFTLDRRIKYEKVKRMLNTEPYKNPKPHDFRQYPDVRDLDIPEFETAFDHDPGNIRFLTEHLNTLWLQERDNEHVSTDEKSLPEMYQTLKERSNWESRLILPKVRYPNKYDAFTRYRNPTRSVQSAYWERVEDHFDERRKKTLRSYSIRQNTDH